MNSALKCKFNLELIIRHNIICLCEELSCCLFAVLVQMQLESKRGAFVLEWWTYAKLIEYLVHMH